MWQNCDLAIASTTKLGGTISLLLTWYTPEWLCETLMWSVVVHTSILMEVLSNHMAPFELFCWYTQLLRALQLMEYTGKIQKQVTTLSPQKLRTTLAGKNQLASVISHQLSNLRCSSLSHFQDSYIFKYVLSWAYPLETPVLSVIILLSFTQPNWLKKSLSSSSVV